MSMSAPSYNQINRLRKSFDGKFDYQRLKAKHMVIDYTDLNKLGDSERVFILERVPEKSFLIDCRIYVNTVFGGAASGQEVRASVGIDTPDFAAASPYNEHIINAFNIQNTGTTGHNMPSTDLLISERENNVILTLTALNYRWEQDSNLNEARNVCSSCGTASSALVFGGINSASATIDSTEEYNGTSWSAGGALSKIKWGVASAGSGNDDGLCSGGTNNTANLSETEEYNGTSWSAGGSMAGARREFQGDGTTTAAFACGGDNGASNGLVTTEEYNGTSWSAGGDLSGGRKSHNCAGTLSAGLAISGLDPTGTFGLSTTEEYNGTTWSSGGTITARIEMGASGSQSSGLAAAGTISGIRRKYTHEYNGTSWTQTADMNIERNQFDCSGSSTSNALGIGGTNGVKLSSVELYTGGYTFFDMGDLTAGNIEVFLSFAH